MKNTILLVVLSALLISLMGISFFRIDKAAKSTASFLENQILFKKKDDGIVVFNNEIKLK